MLTKEENDYLSKIDPNRKVSIHPFDSKGKKFGEAIVKQIKNHFPDLEVLFMGSVALEISGQKDIDIYALATPEEFDKYLPNFEKMFGKLDKQGKYAKKIFIEWKFQKGGYEIEIYLTEPPERQIKVFEILKSNRKLLREYETLKLKFDGKSFRDYQKAKYEFYNRILTAKDNRHNIRIVEFEPKYQGQVVNVVGKGLMELKVIPESAEPLQDEDLYQIPKVYKDRGRFWVAIEKDKVIGTVAIRDMGGGTAKLNRMFVLSNYHGKGIGQALLDHAVTFARNKCFKEIILNTHYLMERAHHFYEKNGFKRVRKEQDKYHYKMNLQV